MTYTRAACYFILILIVQSLCIWTLDIDQTTAIIIGACVGSSSTLFLSSQIKR